jgi:cell division protein FtsI/penicillin-binding protein 2
MANKLQNRRLLLLALLLSIAFAGLGYRLVDLQVLRHEDLRLEARRNTERGYHLPARRGDILDAKGNLLATTAFVKTVCADPALIGNRQAEVAHALAPLLEMKEPDVAQRLLLRTHLSDRQEVITNHYVVLQHKVSLDTWQKITNTMAQLVFSNVNEKALTDSTQKACYRQLHAKAIYADPVDEQLRNYPSHSLAAHVLGYTGVAERTNGGMRVLETIGIDGIERTLNDKLKGVPGWRLTEVDGQQRELVALREENVEPDDGWNAVLTIDSFIQNVLESSLAEALQRETPISISGLVIRPRTGEILALAVLPNFDPANPGASSEDARRNRIIAEMHEPGSTFKIVVVSSALSDHLVTLNDQFDCEHGSFAFAGHVLHDHASYGILTTEGIITKSSNIGAAKIGMRMGETRLLEHMRDFGLGSHTRIPLPGEIVGMVRPENWTKVSIAQVPMGQGVATTSLQMAMAMCALANKGVLMRPLLVDRLQNQRGEVLARYSPQPVRRVISEEADRQMVEALKTVCTPDGTAPKAALEHYTVAGKTGTAQKVPYGSGRFYASFIGFFPADNPEVCIYISMDEPKGNLHQGGQICAPVFKQIAEQVASYLNIKPDKGPDPASPDIPVTNAPPSVRVAARAL